MNLCWEAMVSEMRAERTEADNRRHFTAEKQPIELVRAQLSGWTEIREDPEVIADRTASNLRTAAQHDLFEVG